MADSNENKEEKVVVNRQEMSREDFNKLQEEDKSKKYVESETEKGKYRSLKRMQG